MSLATFLGINPTAGRSPRTANRALLDIDAGALMTPMTYPYPYGSSPVRPFVGRALEGGGGPRAAVQLHPGDNPGDLITAHVDYTGRKAGDAAGARDVSGNRQPAKGSRLRPWLFAGLSSATPADKSASAAAVSPASSTSAGPCIGCL